MPAREEQNMLILQYYCDGESLWDGCEIQRYSVLSYMIIKHAYVSMNSGSLAENNTYTVQWERPGVAEVFSWHGPVLVCAVKMFQLRTWKEYLPL